MFTPYGRARKHEHYCIEGDHRWPCGADPCLRYGASPCVEHCPPEPIKPGLLMPIATVFPRA